jgi:hypothetical protein
MNAQPSFQPQRPQPQPPQKTARQRSHRAKSKSPSTQVYAYRRQGVEVLTKIVTYSTLSIFGIVTLVRLVSYNCEQHGKLQHLDTALKDSQSRTEKVAAKFNRAFDPQSKTRLMESNSYKVAPERRPIVIVSPTAAEVASRQTK